MKDSHMEEENQEGPPSPNSSRSSEVDLDYKSRKLRLRYRSRVKWLGILSAILSLVLFLLGAFSLVTIFFTQTSFFETVIIIGVVYSFMASFVFLIGYKVRNSTSFRGLLCYQNVILLFGMLAILIIGLHCYEDEENSITWNFAEFLMYSPAVVVVYGAYAYLVNILAKFVKRHRNLAEKEAALALKKKEKTKEESHGRESTRKRGRDIGKTPKGQETGGAIGDLIQNQEDNQPLISQGRSIKRNSHSES